MELKFINFGNFDSVMEPETIFKNGASLKSQMSRKNFNRISMVVIALFIVFSSPAQWRATTIDPNVELTYSKGNVYQNRRAMTPSLVREAMYGNSEALQQYNSGRTLNIVGAIVMYPGGLSLGGGVGLLLVTHLSGSVNDENRTGINLASGILIGTGVALVGTGFLIMSSGDKKIKNAVQIHNSSLRSDVSYQLNFGITSTGGVGFTLRF